jgi:hypothetical protein
MASQTDHGGSTAQALREQARNLLEQAEGLDGQKAFVIAHEHEYGTSIYLRWFREHPSEEEAAAVMDSEFEPDREEYLTIEPLGLDDMTGTA